jgi:protocatechuate 3,4-dioxygenase beta subunit
VKEWLNTSRIIVADSWFGSVRTITQLMKHGLYTFVAIKTDCSEFPKAELLAKLQEGLSFAAFKKRVPVEVGK